MGDITYTGSLDGIRQCQFDFIGEVIEKKGYKPKEVAVENVGKAGDNFMGNVKCFIINENGETFKMIVKLAPDAEILRMVMSVETVYRNEMIIYEELLPKFREIQKSAGVKDLYRTAECYGCLKSIPNETLVFEDLRESNFAMMDKFKPLSDAAVRLFIKNLAVFHSLSFVLRNQEPETFDSLSSRLGDLMDTPQSAETLKYFAGIEQICLSVLTDEKHVKHVKGSTTNIYNWHAEAGKLDKDSKYTVLQQGDGWTNNIMFRSEGDVPVECVLIDFQMSKERSPAFDIMYMMFNSTSHEQRQKHYIEYLDLYHEVLDKSLNVYGLKASEVYPRAQLDADLKSYAKFMLAMSLMVSSTTVKDTQEAQKMKDAMKAETLEQADQMMDDMFVLSEDTTTMLRTRVEGIVDSFIEFGYLD